MSLYFFRLRGASDGVNDPDGEEFTSDAAALDHIAASVRAIIEDGVRPGADLSTFVFEVHGHLGQLVATVPFL
jgi:hypothetical protein